LCSEIAPAILGRKIDRGQLAWRKEQSYRWLATFISLWLVVAYLWLALFYPLMCAPYSSDAYAALDRVTAFEHTIMSCRCLRRPG
jgi:hypothetical protein